MTRRVPALSLLIVIPIAPMFAQQSGITQTRTTPRGQEETIRVNTSAVQIEAIVTDKSGRRIKGLTSADFQVMDDGAPQTIDFFSVIEGSRVLRSENRSGSTTGGGQTKTPLSVSPLTNPYRGRHVALVFDDFNLSPENFLRSRRAFADYINTKLNPEDLVAMISTGGALGSLQQFTNDKQRLLSALNRIASQSTLSARIGKPRFNMTAAEAVRIDSGDDGTLRTVRLRVAAEESSVPTGTIADQTAGGRGGGGKMESDADVLDGQIRATAKALVSQISLATRNNLKTLENLLRGMADLPGRKIVVFVTESLITAGGTSGDVSNQLVQLIEVARRGGVSIYALDAAGLHANNTTASEYTTGTGLNLRTVTQELSFSDFENLGAARVLVAGTGGELIANTNDLAGGLDRALEDSSTYYVLGFKPALLDNKFHRLTVSIERKSDLIVRTRRGYLAVNQETVSGTNTELVAALGSPVPRIDVPLEVVASAVPNGNRQIVITGLHVGRNYLTLPEPTATDQTVAYEVLAWVFAAGRDQPVGLIKHTSGFDLAKDPQARAKLKTEGFVFVPAQPFTLPPGLYQIRAVVREKTTGAVGSAYQFFEVPDVSNKKVVSLSSLVLTSAGQNGFNGSYSFKRGIDIDVRYVIYNLPNQTAAVSQRIILLDANGHALMHGELPLAIGSGTAQVAAQATRINLPTARGHYALIVTLRDAKDKIDLERRADFVIE